MRLLCCVTGLRLRVLYGAWDLTRSGADGGDYSGGGGGVGVLGRGSFGGDLVDISGERGRAAGGFSVLLGVLFRVSLWAG